MARQHSAQYTAYIESEHWRVLRAEVLRRAGHQCLACGRRGPLDVHHAYGYRNLGRERPEELQAVCRSCHDAVHGRGRWNDGDNGAGCLRTLLWIAVVAIALQLA